ncbi:MAG: hypothetical protein M3128_11475 [Verrucomicrobiota bacterium]|nr:hypothetical protein [Verrucomicrobiota bacterium]
MGVHTGPVNTVADVNERANVAGAGMNMAQRVMDCGDAGHILLSQRVAEDLGQSREWSQLLHDLGECEVKHGARVHLFNFHGDDFGNAAIPTRVNLGRQSHKRRPWLMPVAIGALVLLALGLVSYQFIGKRQGAPATIVPEKSIAVLPFENLSEDKSNAYFAEGMQDEILTRLANLSELKVISRTSTAKYQSHPGNLKTIAAELGVASILEGTVQKLANDVHINVQLIKASTDEHIWAQSFDRTIEHAFAVEGEVAQKVADALKLRLAPAQIAKLTKAPTENAKAYDLFLQGEYEMHRAWAAHDSNVETAAKAASYYEEAAQLDPQFVLAIASLARAQLSQYHLHLESKGPEGAPETAGPAKANIDRALMLAPDLALGHLAFGEWYLWIKHDHPNAIRELQRALELDGHLTDAQVRLCAIWQRESQPEKAIVELRKALEVDPRNVFLYRNLGFAYDMLRHYNLAAASFARAVSLEPSDTIDSLNLAAAYTFAGDFEAARRILDSFPADRRTDNTYYFVRRRLLRLQHDFQGMAEILKLMPESALAPSIRMEHEGDIALALGQTDLAQQRFEGARALFADVFAKNDKAANAYSFIAYLDARLHHAPEAIEAAKHAVELAQQGDDVWQVETSLVQLATIYSLLGQRDEAIEVLQRVIAMPSGDVFSAADLKHDVDWDPIRDDPRFQKLIASVEQQER